MAGEDGNGRLRNETGTSSRRRRAHGSRSAGCDVERWRWCSGGGSSIQITNNITTGMGSGVVNRDLQSRAFAYFGMSSAGKSDVFIAQIIREFERMLAKSAIGFRTMGLS